jgi:hypothetical protein
MIASPNQLYNILSSSFRTRTPVQVSLEQLKFAFGFKRMDGLEITLRKLFTNRTELDIQTAPPLEIIKNVQEWAAEQGFICVYLDEEDAFLFPFWLPPKQDGI